LLHETGQEYPFGDAPSVITMNGGYHVYAKQPVGRAPLGNSNRNLPPGIDVRGAGGYVVAPSSVMSTGQFYEPVPAFPDLAEAYAAGTIPTVPDWIVDGIEWRPPVEERGPIGSSDNPAENHKRALDDRFHESNHIGCHRRFLASPCVAVTS
jgi:Bifunctional DNA primase/polymerase, N-terminal